MAYFAGMRGCGGRGGVSPQGAVTKPCVSFLFNPKAPLKNPVLQPNPRRRCKPLCLVFHPQGAVTKPCVSFLFNPTAPLQNPVLFPPPRRRYYLDETLDSGTLLEPILLTAQYSLRTTYHLPRITQWSLLTTNYLLLTTNYLLLTIYHLLLTTYYSLLILTTFSIYCLLCITCYLLLTTH